MRVGIEVVVERGQFRNVHNDTLALFDIQCAVVPQLPKTCYTCFCTPRTDTRIPQVNSEHL